MKKIYFMAMIATAVLTVTSCSNEDITTGGDFSKNETSGQAISFSTYLGRTPISRAAETQTGADMGVYAFLTTAAFDANTQKKPNYMCNQQVTSDKQTTPTWSYSPIKYWPNNTTDKISFFAYAPYGAAGVTMTGKEDGGIPKATVTLQDPDKMVDFVAANAMNKTAADGTSVSFSMKHEMARAAFKATTTVEAGTTVTIKSITLSGTKLYKGGTYTFPTTNGAKGTWAVTDNSDYTITVPLTNSVLSKNASSIDVYNYLFLIPVSTFAEGDVKATITYEIETTDTNLSTGKVTTSATKEIKLPAGTLAQGKAYVYTFNIKLNQVTLTATAAEWGTDTNNTLDVSAQ